MSAESKRDTPEGSSEAPETPKKAIGRPRKTDVAAKKRGNRKAVGRPKGDAAIINEYKARMLNSPKSRKVLDAIFNAALDDKHKHQAAAWKLVMDRIVPASYFEKDTKNASRPSIEINIKGIGSPELEVRNPDTDIQEDIQDVEYEEIP